MEWCGIGETTLVKVKTLLCTGKVFTAVFLDAKSVQGVDVLLEKKNQYGEPYMTSMI